MAYLVPRYDPALVLASVVIATLSACVMLDFAKRTPTMGRLAAGSMLLAGSVATGTGLWSMHFVGMLAYTLPVPLGYARLQTAALRRTAGHFFARPMPADAWARGNRPDGAFDLSPSIADDRVPA